jgi:hypothetical protein
VGKINSKVTNSSIATDYNFVDKTAPIGITYYRLRWVDLSGIAEKSNSIVLNRNNQTTTVNVSPIPATDVLHINISNTDTQTPVTFAVVDVVGRTVLSETQTPNGNNSYTLAVGNLSAGIYFLRVSVNGVDTMQKWVKD